MKIIFTIGVGNLIDQANDGQNDVSKLSSSQIINKSMVFGNNDNSGISPIEQTNDEKSSKVEDCEYNFEYNTIL